MSRRLRPQGAILSWYILRAHAGPFLFSVTTLMFLFLLQFVMKFIDQLVGKGLTAWVIMELVILNLSWMLVLAVPMSVLVAVLMAFGELSSRNEITVMKASGVSIYRLLAPVLIAGVVVALGMVWFNNFVLPESNHRLKTLTVDIRRKKPTLTILDGVFSHDISGYSILVRKTFEENNDLEGITLYDYRNPVQSVVIAAERGKISFSPDYRKLILDLQEGEVHELDLQKTDSYRRARFTSLRRAMNVQGFDFERSSTSTFSRGDREMSAEVMTGIVDSLRGVRGSLEEHLQVRMTEEARRLVSTVPDTLSGGPVHVEGQTPTARALQKAQFLSTEVTSTLFRMEMLNKQIGQYLVEIHKKYAIPAACLVFVLIGVPLGIMARRGGFGIAATLSLGFFILYWACLIGGEKLADRSIVSPWLGMWAANIIIGLLGAYLTFRVGRETLLINWNFLYRFIPRQWRTPMVDEDGNPVYPK
ncbi:MAG: LptF/LptG family permease [Bacteroidota bacterium]